MKIVTFESLGMAGCKCFLVRRKSDGRFYQTGKNSSWTLMPKTYDLRVLRGIMPNYKTDKQRVLRWFEQYEVVVLTMGDPEVQVFSDPYLFLVWYPYSTKTMQKQAYKVMGIQS